MRRKSYWRVTQIISNFEAGWKRKFEQAQKQLDADKAVAKAAVKEEQQTTFIKAA
jgi:hypothetical protein